MESKKVLERPWVCWGGSVASTRGLGKPSELRSFRTPASTKKKKVESYASFVKSCSRQEVSVVIGEGRDQAKTLKARVEDVRSSTRNQRREISQSHARPCDVWSVA